MRVLLTLLVFSLYCSLSFSYIIGSDEPGDSLQWPSEYHFKAEKLCLKTGVVESFEVWYSAEQNRSRIDFYDGSVKRFYQIEPEEESPTVYQINPVTTDDVTNKLVCEKLSDEEIIDYLPNVDDYTYSGEQPFDGKTVQVWKYVSDDEEYKTESTLYVYRDGDTDVPVRSETIQFKSWNEGLHKHVITNYYSFKTKVNSDDLDAERAEECSDLGKIGENIKVDLQFLHPRFPGDVDKAFHSYKNHHNKKYSKSEHEMRKAIFEDNWRRVVEHNRKNLGYKLEVNKFADRSEAELAHLTGTRSSGANTLGTVPYPYSEQELKAMEDELPLNYDMRIDGVISPVKNQGDCGSCWAFSSTAAVEGAIARSNGGRRFDLSEQSMVDCAWSENLGCGGGLVEGAFKYISTHGLPTDREYGPYLQQDGFCNLENMTEVHTIKGFARVPSLSETALKAVLYKYGPVTVSIQANTNMNLYSSGIFYDVDCKKNKVNHGVTVVGYGVRDDVNYWIVKNSWGEDWGEDGYILMSSANDNCNVMSEAYYPIV